MSEAWVVNASPLILFARIGRLELLARLAPALMIPDAVLNEVRHGQKKDETAIMALSWAERYRVTGIAIPDRPDIRRQKYDVEVGPKLSGPSGWIPPLLLRPASAKLRFNVASWS